MSIRLSDYLVFVDESGDHNLAPHDASYPIFVLAFLIIERKEYQVAETGLQEFKLKHFGRTVIILHEHKITKHKGEFVFLVNEACRYAFFEDLNALMQRLNYTIIATAIHKQRFAGQYRHCKNPYHLALEFCMERLYFFLKRKGNLCKTPIVFGSRGHKEDAELKQVFLKLRAAGRPRDNQGLPFTMDFALKQANIAGLQIADLIARPVGRRVLNPTQQNRAFTILEKKLDCMPDRKRYLGYGLKIFP